MTAYMVHKLFCFFGLHSWHHDIDEWLHADDPKLRCMYCDAEKETPTITIHAEN